MRAVLVLVVLTVVLGTSLILVTAQPPPLTVYSGRNRELIEPLLDQFGKATGILVMVRYGETAELAATIMEEGQNSPADVYFAQDAGALGALAYAGRLRRLPESTLQRVDARFRSSDRTWVGGSGWAPTNGSFQAHVTALRLLWGNERARQWLAGIKANGVRAYRNNTAIVAAVGAGEIDVGFVNHYYLFSFLRERGQGFPARNYYFPGADAGNLVNVAGAGIVDTARNAAGAQRLVEFLLSADAPRYFANETIEYPLAGGVATNPLLLPLSQIKTPKIDLNHLQALEETLKLLREAGIL